MLGKESDKKWAERFAELDIGFVPEWVRTKSGGMIHLRHVLGFDIQEKPGGEDVYWLLAFLHKRYSTPQVIVEGLETFVREYADKLYVTLFGYVEDNGGEDV